MDAQTLFAPLGPTYDRYAALLSFGQDPRWRRFLVSRVEAGAGDRVLDVATGTAAVALELVRQKGCAVVGVDQSAGMLESARRRVDGRVELVQASAEALPFADAEFDALTFTYLLRYVDDPAATLRELVRVVRPGGTVAALEFGAAGRRRATAVGALRPRGPAGRGRGDRRRLARGRVVPRPVDPRLLRALAGAASARGMARGRDRRAPCATAVARRRDRDVGTEDLGGGHLEEGGVRPAFYALRPGGWRDYVTLLHAPYTAWHLSYVAVGAALAPRFHLDRMLWALAAFALAMGVAAHALDELNGRPLRTAIPSRTLVVLAVVSLAGALAIGVGAAIEYGLGLLVFVAVGALPRPGLQPGALWRPLPHRLVVRAHLGRFRGADRVLRRGAGDPAGGRARRRLRDRAEPGATAAVHAGSPRPPNARRHDRDGAARTRPPRADLGGGPDRLRARGGAPNLEPCQSLPPSHSPPRSRRSSLQSSPFWR